MARFWTSAVPHLIDALDVLRDVGLDGSQRFFELGDRLFGDPAGDDHLASGVSQQPPIGLDGRTKLRDWRRPKPPARNSATILCVLPRSFLRLPLNAVIRMLQHSLNTSK